MCKGNLIKHLAIKIKKSEVSESEKLRLTQFRFTARNSTSDGIDLSMVLPKLIV